MSYDLNFYKRKDSQLSSQVIRNYLNEKLNSSSDNSKQWFFVNPNTDVYYNFEENEPDDNTDPVEFVEDFEFFEDTNFTFSINYIRPDFFGLEAFAFVDKFIADLNLLVLDPQLSTDLDEPFIPAKGELYNNWSALNLRHSAYSFEEFSLCYYPLEKSNSLWEYNFSRTDLQNNLGGGYFVPRIFFFKIKSTNEIVSVSSWTENIPCILPDADYFLIVKKYRSFLKIIEEIGLIPSKTLFSEFADFLEDYPMRGCKIIRPANTKKTGSIFNKLKLDLNYNDLMERIDVEKVVNNK